MRTLLRLFLIGLGSLEAHQIAEMPMAVEIDGDKVSAVIEVDAAYMLPEFRGDEDEDPKDLAWLREIDPSGWKKIEAESEQYWKECLHFEADGKELPWTLRIPEFHEEKPGFVEEGDAEDLPLVDVVIDARMPAGTHKLDAIWKEPFGVVLIVTTGSGSEAETIPLVSGERGTLAERDTATPVMEATAPSIGRWIVLGFEHILPKGVDHVLFVLGLFLLVPKWRPLLQQTIVFTVAHSLSLAGAALGWLTFPSTGVEILIAASITWIGMENLWAKKLGKWRLALVGAFGLIHGLGFASVLAELLPADQPEKLPAALFGFNLGVECGQIAVLSLAFLAFGIGLVVVQESIFLKSGGREHVGVWNTRLNWWRTHPGWWQEGFVWVRRIGSGLIALAGLVLIVERLADVEITPFL